ncbi:IS66 family insertion sequence element accessory protein TnpB [Stutzerimonas nitrititolerans]|uniref:IS66 family insertion sequence element accessory protein TnpB n=1 Tax=Stutzerimonas nitrititolerans TaxID=2482751 RepID=UPI0028A09D3A|nr:IS66 family insertion sequence element accessory protein TnpB [Stutzerimonas nitrititolerans]
MANPYCNRSISPIYKLRPDAKSAKIYLYPKPVDFRKSINGLAALVALDIKVEIFNPVLLAFLNRSRSQVKILYWERNGFLLVAQAPRGRAAQNPARCW